MHAVIKSISNDVFDLKTYQPEDPACFFLILRIRIGSNESSGADDFDLRVCTPRWLLQNIYDPLWMRHFLIVREYDFASVEKSVFKYVEQIQGDKWVPIAEKLARVFAWEFEDYLE